MTSLSVPQQALDYWADRLTNAGLSVQGPFTRFDEQFLAFKDPDGLSLELVGDPRAEKQPEWPGGTVPAKWAIRSGYSVTMTVASYEPTAALLTHLGFQPVAQSGNRYRYAADDLAPGALVDVLHQPELPRGHVAVGSIHHVAWRTPNDAEQEAWRHKLSSLGLHVTPMQDRQYFHSIYFREPGGVLFEIATDPPGFAFDEPVGDLGSSLKLPPWLERSRSQIEQALPPIRRPAKEL